MFWQDWAKTNISCIKSYSSATGLPNMVGTSELKESEDWVGFGLDSERH